jgi:hypothetical protein
MWRPLSRKLVKSAGALQDKTPPASKAVVPIGGEFVQVKPDAFPADFAADVAKPTARFMALSQVPISAAIFGAQATTAAWTQKPSYAVIAQQDRMINPDLERFMSTRAKSTTIELPGSHAIFLSHPKDIAADGAATNYCHFESDDSCRTVALSNCIHDYFI